MAAPYYAGLDTNGKLWPLGRDGTNARLKVERQRESIIQWPRHYNVIAPPKPFVALVKITPKITPKERAI